MKLFLALCLSAAVLLPLQAAEKKSAKEKEEEAVRLEAQRLMTSAQGGRIPIIGKLNVAKELAEDAKPFPKVVGLVSGKDGNGYPILVLMKGMYDQLTPYNLKDVTLMGKLIDRGDKGKVYAIDEIVLAPAPPPTRRKRGGL